MTLTPTLTWRQILALAPCATDRNAARARLKAAFPDYRTRALTVADAADAGVDLDSLIWIAGCVSEADPDCVRRLRLFAADCAARVVHLAKDPRSTAAIVAARAFARGEIDEAQWAAARDAAWDAAWDAARDAAWAAAWDARDIERQWQRDRLAAWFSDDEPTDWPIKSVEMAA